MRGEGSRELRRTDQAARRHRWQAFVKPAKKLAVGERVRFGEANEGMACLLSALDATVEEKGDNGEVLFAFEFTGPALDEAIERFGETPLPPYIAARRAPAGADRADYQTLFAPEAGAVAAPTAGLHFTPALADAVEAAGASLHRVTLHVGAGRSCRSRPTIPTVTGCTANGAGSTLRRPTRSTRPGEPAGGSSRRDDDPEIVGKRGGRARRRSAPFEDETAIFITPGYRFRAVDVLLTNFHLPRSTLLMLAAAFCGLERIRAAYAHAISSGYRFYSYGDATWLERER